MGARLGNTTLSDMDTLLTRRHALILLVGAASSGVVVAASCTQPASSPAAPTETPVAQDTGHVHGAAPAGQARVQPTPAPPSPPVDHFSIPLPVLSTLQPSRADASADEYELTERVARVELLPGLPTTAWTYNGSFPGPVIRVRRGRTARVRVVNQLSTETVVHLHGAVTPAESDGFPMDLIPPGGERQYTYPNEHRGSTLWYHDHTMDATGRNIYMGLAGVYIVEDEQEDALALPHGDYDVPLVIMNRQFAADGSFVYPDGDKFGATGDLILVNGAPWPSMEVAQRRYRLRILNASNSDTYTLALSSGQPLVQIATEGGLLPAPVSSQSIPLGMAERVEVVVDFAAYPLGSQIVLQNQAATGPKSELMRFDVVRAAQDDSQLPSSLGMVQPLREDQATQTRSFTFEETQVSDAPAYAWTINGQTFDPDRSDASPRLGDVEIWTFRNVPFPGVPFQPIHPVHMHLVDFQILDRDGAPPAPYETGWKDTVIVHPNETVRVIARFEGYRGRYLLHCHNLEHEDHAMMARFDVT
jgi:spore coat protein A